MSEITIAIFMNPLAGTGKYRRIETEITAFADKGKNHISLFMIRPGPHNWNLSPIFSWLGVMVR